MISLRSAITQKLLKYFFLHADDCLYVNELSRKLHVDKRNLVKKLKELEDEGILQSDRHGNLKLYSIRKGYPLYDQYKTIIYKTVGIEQSLRDIVSRIKGIQGAYLYGSYVQDTMDSYSDIDILIVGEHDIVFLQRELSKLQNNLGREVNAVHMDNEEFKKRVKRKDPFITNVLRKKHIELV